MLRSASIGDASQPHAATVSVRRLRVGFCILLVFVSGCKSVVSDKSPIRVSGRKVLSDDSDAHYRTAARRASQTIVTDPSNIAVSQFDAAPRTIRHRTNDAPWNVSLIETVQLAVRNNPVIRQSAQFLSPGNPLLRSPDQNPSVFDLALQQTNVQFGSRGPDAAWSDFYPTLTSSLSFGRDLTVPNNTVVDSGPEGSTLAGDTAQFRVRVDQPLMTGGTLSVFNNIDYSQDNQVTQIFPSAYTGELGAELRQPLWAGAGIGFTEVAGPISLRSPIQSGVFQGIRIAHINQRIAAADFEMTIRSLVRDVGDVYWQLFQAFREYESDVAVRDASYDVWQQIQANEDAVGGALVAQAEHTYLDSRSRAENSLAAVYETETRLRRLMGLPVTDGRLLTPNALPMTGEANPDWAMLVSEAFQYRIELHRQKLAIQSFDWQLQAARSLVNPRLDFVGRYRLNGFGDRLISGSNDDGKTERGYNSALGSMFTGEQTGWDLGLSFSMPIGFRGELAQMRNLELKSAKARAALAAQEQEITHELSSAVQQLARWYTVLQTNDERRKVAQRQVDALDAEYRAGQGDRQTIDLLLRAQQTLSFAQSEYYRSLTQYNIAQWDLEFRKGTLLISNQLHFETVVASKDDPAPTAATASAN